MRLPEFQWSRWIDIADWCRTGIKNHASSSSSGSGSGGGGGGSGSKSGGGGSGAEATGGQKRETSHTPLASIMLRDEQDGSLSLCAELVRSHGHAPTIMLYVDFWIRNVSGGCSK